MFQLVHLPDGVRSEPIVQERSKFARIIQEKQTQEEIETLGVLVVMDQIKGEWDVSTAPFMSAQFFIDHFGV